jgi:hypothetical protein
MRLTWQRGATYDLRELSRIDEGLKRTYMVDTFFIPAL